MDEAFHSGTRAPLRSQRPAECHCRHNTVWQDGNPVARPDPGWGPSFDLAGRVGASRPVDFLKIRELAAQVVTRSRSLRRLSLHRLSAVSMQNHLPPQLPPQPVALAPAPSGSISQFKETDDLQLENGPGDGTILVDIDETGWRALRPRPSLDPNDPLVWLAPDKVRLN